MKRMLIALFIALVLFCATGGLDRFSTDTEPGVEQQAEQMTN